MGHWLDGLLNPPTGAGGIIIQWDGANMAARGILAFGEQFLLIDDSIANRTLVSIRHLATGGDVIGSTEDLRVVQIRGAEDGENVTVFANALRWDTSVSAGSAEISLSDVDAGALRVRHQSTDVAIFAASGAVIGNTAGIQRMRGGHRLSLRSVGSVTLDDTVKDSIAWIDATGERTVTLPPASAGRTLLLPFVGDNPPTLARAGAELINGLPSDYDLMGDANGGLAIAVSDGVNWVARTIKDGGGEGSTALVGDVNGDSDANIITRISGSGGEVLVLASTLIFSAGGDATIETSGETEGALAVTHDGIEVLLASSNIPTFGVATAQTSLRGGVRLQTRNVDGAIDETTSDAICWIDASTEGTSATLPPATQGRVLFLPFVGENPPTLQRAGLELINGVAADFDLEGDGTTGGLAIAVSDGTNWVARTIGAAPPPGVDPSRAINTTAPLTGGGTLAADLTLGIDPAAYVAPARTISVSAPLTGGGDLSANRTIGLDPTGYVAPTRTISTTAPLTGGGALSANLTLGINAASYVAPTRTISTTAPLAGGGTLAGDLTLTIDTSAFATATRAINTTAPLTGGGNLSADRTLAVSDATGLAKGVLQLAGNLAGTAAAPLVTGLKADTFSFETAAAAAKGSWTTTGLRIGDATAPGEKLEVVGNVLATAASAKITAQNTNSGFDITTAAPCLVADANIAGGNAIILGIVNAIRRGSIRWDSAGNMGYNAVATHHWFSGLTTTVPIMNASSTGLRIGDTAAAAQKLDVVGNAVFGSSTSKIWLGGQIGSEATLSAIWMGTVAPTTTNYAILYDTSNQRTSINAIGKIHMRFAGIDSNTWTSTGLRLGDTTAPTKRLEVAGSADIGKTDHTSSIGIFGSQTVTVKSVSATFTIDTTTLDYLVLVDATSAGIQINLPSPTLGRLVRVKRTAGTNSVDVRRSSGLIEAASMITARLATDPASSGIHPYVTLVGNGTDWRIINHFSCTLQSS